MRKFPFVLGAVAVALMTIQTANAQSRKKGGRSRPGADRPRFMPPIMKVLDANGDGVIDAEEISNAAAALKKLDKNNDGKLTREELMPHGFGRGGFGGPGGPAGRKGPGGRGNFAERLMQFDKNKDGKISKEEAPERMQRFFDRLDANGDGFIDKEEIEKLSQRFRSRRWKRDGRGKGGKRPSPDQDR